MAEHVLALDLGTTGVRALVVGADGAIRARAWRPLSSRFPQLGWFEQDPAEYWTRSNEAVCAALAAARLSARDLAAIGVVTQRATTLAWDAGNGVPLGPAIGWQDQRTGARVGELVAQGIPVSTMTSGTKFEWLLRHEPALREASRTHQLRLGTPDVWLTDRLTGGAAFATDASQASCTGLYDLRSGAWSAPALELFEIECAWLPALVATNAVVGETPRAWLGASVPVAARAGDQQAATFAQGALAPGAAKLTVGTSAIARTPQRRRAGACPARRLSARAVGTRARAPRVLSRGNRRHRGRRDRMAGRSRPARERRRPRRGRRTRTDARRRSLRTRAARTRHAVSRRRRPRDPAGPDARIARRARGARDARGDRAALRRRVRGASRPRPARCASTADWRAARPLSLRSRMRWGARSGAPRRSRRRRSARRISPGSRWASGAAQQKRSPRPPRPGGSRRASRTRNAGSGAPRGSAPSRVRAATSESRYGEAVERTARRVRGSARGPARAPRGAGSERCTTRTRRTMNALRFALRGGVGFVCGVRGMR